ncbi:hypothetical protein CsSME_00051627 [Camellia sinensis var. sinensis]
MDLWGVTLHLSILKCSPRKQPSKLLIENEYLGLKNGILDQSAILLSSYGCLTCMNCKYVL